MKKFFCPVPDGDCPYCDEDSYCTIGAKPWEECDTAAYYHDEDEEE